MTMVFVALNLQTIPLARIARNMMLSGPMARISEVTVAPPGTES